jgi:hypothetical protein
LGDSGPTHPGGRLVEPADETFPQKNGQTSRSDQAAELRVLKKSEEQAAAEEDYPRTRTLVESRNRIALGMRKRR